MSQERLLVFNQTRESILSLAADSISGLAGRLRGPSLGAHMRPGGGIWIPEARVLNTIGAKSSIDIVLLGGSNQVIEIEEHVGPFHVRTLSPEVAGLLALPLDTVRDSKTELGDEIAISPNDGIQQVLAMYANGGPVEPHAVKGVTKSGAFVETPDRWYPGTIVDMTLRYDEHYAKLAKMGDAAKESVNVRAKVVRPTDDGVEVEFIFLRSGEQSRVKRFVRRV